MTELLFPLSMPLSTMDSPPTLGATTPFPPALITLFPDDETRWSAVQTRDATADGFFVYAVKSTKIYCRPICKARLARRANVRFFTFPNEARDAGFRACKRCKPDEKGYMPEEKAVSKIKEFVRNDGEGEGGSLSQMARRSGLSKWHFHRVFKRTMGVTPVEFVRMKRKGNSFDLESRVSGQLSGATTTTGESPATGSGDSLDWLQEMEGEDFDFETLGSLLKDSEGVEASETSDMVLGKESDGALTWTDFLNLTEESNGFSQPGDRL